MLFRSVNFAKENGILIIVCYDKVENIVKRFKHNNSDKFWMEKVGVSSVEEFITKIQEGFLKMSTLGGNKTVNLLDMSKIVRIEKEVPRVDDKQE